MFSRKARWLLVLLAAGAAWGCTGSGMDDSGSGSPTGDGGAVRAPSPEGDVLAAVPESSGDAYSPEQIRLGRKLATTMGCNDCHTPWAFNEKLGAPAPDMTRMLSGHPAGAAAPEGGLAAGAMMTVGATGTSFVMPFGVVYAANLTPDVDTGIGSWNEEMFLNVFRKGTHMGGGGRPVLPPMPWLNVAALEDREIVAIYAFLRSIPPIRNGVKTFNPPPEVMDGISRTNQKLLEEMAARAPSGPRSKP